MSEKKKIAFINQRYGIEIGGGSEFETMMYAERLTKDYEVHVLTTCALEYTTWENYYEPGAEIINGVHVHRFLTDFPRAENFPQLCEALFFKEHTKEESLAWIEAQGPCSSSFLEYLKENIDTYDVFLPMTYLYWPTFHAMQIVGHKSVFTPTAHDEPPIYLKAYADIFCKAKAINYNAVEERHFVENQFHNESIKNEVIGCGVDLAEVPDGFNLNKVHRSLSKGRYLAYIGRVDESKGCKALVEHFLSYLTYSGSDIKLVFMGKAVMDIPKHPQIISLGFVSDEVKAGVLKNAMALAMPSFFESLSLVTLESMLLGIPVVVNGQCEVLKGHCLRSNAGLYYENRNEFIKVVELFEKNPNHLCEKFGQNGILYVEENYTWGKVISKLKRLIEYI